MINSVNCEARFNARLLHHDSQRLRLGLRLGLEERGGGERRRESEREPTTHTHTHILNVYYFPIIFTNCILM